ncbi:hypothetical protein EXIGLDRAFT_726851 [Exidia glandulosa HHB12029]|uniref:Uncharacterized protein n=1 Tax=Exidia glandulosa HHB12029 TaxID=1314781 RepID=A0A165DKP0_EXIGL|nr:hypothetical protein EXIGLDRAFT_726851 [Exidia glandulosa HHB12029]
MAQVGLDRATRMAFYEDIRRQYQDRAVTLQRARDDARALALQTDAVLRSISVDLGFVDERIVELDSIISNLRGYMDPRIVASLPTELLRQIFSVLAADVAARWEMETKPSMDDLRLPYRLESVCRRWRAEVLDCPALWASVIVPLADSEPEIGHVNAHVARCIARSGRLPLDITCLWNMPHEQPIVAPELQQMILDSLGAESNRWGRCSFAMPYLSFPGTSLSESLRRSTPLLEELYIAGVTSNDFEGDEPEHPAYYLPHCPNLRTLVSKDSDVLLSHPHAPLLSLVHLRIVTELAPPTAVWTMLQLAPSLQHFDFSLGDDTSMSPVISQSRLSLPALQTLAVRIFAAGWLNAWAPQMDMPNLRRLELDTAEPELFDLHQLFSRIESTVVELSLCNDGYELNERHCEVVRTLPNIRSLHLGEWENILPSFFRELAAPSLCPQLESFSVGGRQDIDQTAAEAIAHFVRSRTVGLPSDSSTPRRLASVDLESAAGVPAWLKDQVATLLTIPACS